MSRFHIAHPTRPDLHAEAGHDPLLSYFVDIMKGHRVIKSYDSWHPLFNRARPLMGALDYLASEGFYTGDDLEDALAMIADDLDVPKRLVRVVDVVMAFKSAAE